MPNIQAEGVINRIIKQIAQECIAKGEQISETLVAFMVKAVVLDPNSPFHPEKALNKEDVAKLIKVCEHHRVMDARLEPIICEAIEIQGGSKAELEDCYRKITSAVLLRSGLGSPTNIDVVRETTAALQSIFPQTELGEFLTYTTFQKRKQLLEFAAIVIGIRLYNRHCEKGGVGIDNIPYLLDQGIPITMATLHEQINQANEISKFYTTLFLQNWPTEAQHESANSTHIKSGNLFKQSNLTLHLLKTAIINSKLYEYFLKVIEKELNQMIQVVEKLQGSHTQNLNRLHEFISNRSAVPSSEVYPSFIQISKSWSAFQDEMVYLTVLSSTLNTLKLYFIGSRAEWTKEKLEYLILDSNITNEDEIDKCQPNPRLSDEERAGYQCLFPNSEDKNLNLNIAFEGFCAWSLIHYEGLLVPGDIDMGVMVLPPDNKLYAFSCHKNVREFILASEKLLVLLPGIARCLPELIPFLKLNYMFNKGMLSSHDRKGALFSKPVGKVEAGIQTMVHPIDTFIDPNYEWNEWELRRKAIKLVNLRQKATSSVQTTLSNYRRDNVTQVYLPKDSWTTTRKIGYTQVPKPSTFIHGLRGCGSISEADGAKEAIRNEQPWSKLYRNTIATKIDLTIPIEFQSDKDAIK